ncbi:MAG: alanine racemase [bacterium]
MLREILKDRQSPPFSHPAAQAYPIAASELFHPATAVALIDLGALRRNTERILERVRPRGILAVVKWNGYGHGLVPCARIMAQAGVTGFGVSSVAEGIELRKAGFAGLILVMADWVGKPLKKFIEWDLHAAATSWFKVEYVEAGARKLGRRIAVHTKFDTGLGRLGMPWQRAKELLPRIARMKSLEVKGIYSHLAFQRPQDFALGEKQIVRFKRILSLAQRCGLEPEWTHLANSAAAIVFPEVPGNLVRTGIALYGQPPSREVAKLFPLEPVMTLKAPILEVRRVRRGHGVPHPVMATAPADGWAVRIPVGTRCGYPASLLRRGLCLFRGRRMPLLGTILGEQSWLFVPGPRPNVGKEIVLWGRRGNETIWLYELAESLEALPYELPTWLSEKVPRIFVE